MNKCYLKKIQLSILAGCDQLFSWAIDLLPKLVWFRLFGKVVLFPF